MLVVKSDLNRHCSFFPKNPEVPLATTACSLRAQQLTPAGERAIQRG
jgi:hypothetical protein